MGSSSGNRLRPPPVIAEGLFSYQIGGSERVSADLALAFSRRGYRVLCFAFYDSDGPIRNELEAVNIRCIDLNYQKSMRLTRRITYQFKFWQMLRNEKVHSLHVHHATALILCGVAASLAKTKKIMMTEHGLYQLQERPAYRKSAARYCRFADEITVVEPSQADFFEEKMGVPRPKLHYVANGVKIGARSTEAVLQARARLEISDDTFAFFYVGRLNPVKDLGTMLEAFAAIPDVGERENHLYIVGDGPERGALEQKVAALNIGARVHFLGVRSDVGQVLLAGDAFAMSSLTEGLPMALLEAMAAELPCVATAVGGIPELFSHERGLVVPPKDSKALSEAMTRLACEPELRSKLIRNAFENVQRNYSLEAVTDRYLELLGLPHRWPQ